ncbi:MAG TPA: hypothetical protein VKK79_10320 [Candidatus Lokiarchaeia archaeon]|nr:hypothetical protein [Candidatus Lokiarchaeia archaeon]
MPTKEDYLAALNATWLNMRQFLEKIIKTSKDGLVTRENIVKMGEIAAKISVGGENKDLDELITEIDAFVRQWKEILTGFLGGKQVYILNGLQGEIFFKNFFNDLSDANREWAGHKGFPEGYGQFDWPEISIERVTGAIELARACNGRINLHIGMSTLESLADYWPDFIETIKQAWSDGIIEVIDGAYTQTFDYALGGEANLRMLRYGLEVADNLLGRHPTIGRRQVLGWHPQQPQLLRSCGYEGVAVPASSSHPMMEWKGIDGSKIKCLPSFQGIPPLDPTSEQLFHDILKTLATVKSAAIESLALNIVGNILDPSKGRENLYLITAREIPLGPLLTYSDCFQDIQTPAEDEAIPFDQLGVQWHCQADGMQDKRGRLYNALKSAEFCLLEAEMCEVLEFLIRPDSNFGALQDRSRTWKTFLQAANCEALLNPGNLTGNYFKDKLRDLGKYQGPRPGLTIGDKALQFCNKVMQESQRETRTHAQQIALNLAASAVVEKNDNAEAAGSVLVINPLFEERPSLFEIAIPRAQCHLEGPDGTMPLQQMTAQGTILVEDTVPIFGGKLYTVVKGVPPRNARTIDVRWDEFNRVAESDIFQIKFDEEGRIIQIYDRPLRSTLLQERTPSLFAHGKPEFKVLETGPIRLILEIRGKTSDRRTTRMTLCNRTRRIDFETDLAKKPAHVRWYFQSECSKVQVDFPFGVEETGRENATGLNFSLVSGEGPVAFQIGNGGMQNYSFLANDVSDRELEKKINSQTMRTGGVKVVTNQLVENNTHHYFFRPIPQPITPAEAYREVLRYWQSPHATFVETVMQACEFPTFQISDPNVIITGCYMVEEAGVEIRLVNYAPENSDCQIKVPAFLLEKSAKVVNTLSITLQDVPISSGELTLVFHGWEFKTVRFS